MSQLPISPVTTKRASQPNECDTATSGCILIQTTLMKMSGSGPASQTQKATWSVAAYARGLTLQMHKYRNAAQLTTPKRVESAMLRVSLWPDLRRQISGVARYLSWNRTPMKSQSVMDVASPDSTTARRK